MIQHDNSTWEIKEGFIDYTNGEHEVNLLHTKTGSHWQVIGELNDGDLAQLEKTTHEYLAKKYNQ
jgi:hypothetical protein